MVNTIEFPVVAILAATVAGSILAIPADGAKETYHQNREGGQGELHFRLTARVKERGARLPAIAV